ncbi:FMN-binding negative transcriptional regulator [Streptomyces sp. NPDC088560]|uniref:FMN-binding negative transcriptional regulator n=1 Tax=Streptomyces sp. NPDC088560 TaxID=3365868 RepID=UPI0037F503B7
MYVPKPFMPEDTDVRDLLTGLGACDLVTMTPQGLQATLLPFEHDRDTGELGSLIGHMARANGHWREPVQGEAMVIVHGPQAYVSPTWYATKAEHHRVVPTWNYVVAHVYGQLVVHDDPAWVEAQMRRLTDRHEAGSAEPWSIDQAPAKYGGAVARGRRRRSGHQPDRGQGQAQPEPARAERRGRHSRAGGARSGR